MFEQNNFHLIFGKSILEMQNLIDNSIKVDMICCDLPFGTTACSWDVVIPFDQLWSCYKQLIKENGAIVLFGSQPFTTDLINSNREWFRYEIIWEKEQGTNPMLAQKQPLKCHENIIVFYKKQPTYNPQKTKGKPYSGFNSKNGKTIGEVYGSLKSTHKENSGDRFPKSVQQFNTEGGFHPTQKPITLVEWLIATYTNKDEIVLDNTMGSGTSGIACMKLGRKFIGIEDDTIHFSTAKKRISESANDLNFLDIFID